METKYIHCQYYVPFILKTLHILHKTVIVFELCMNLVAKNCLGEQVMLNRPAPLQRVDTI